MPAIAESTDRSPPSLPPSAASATSASSASIMRRCVMVCPDIKHSIMQNVAERRRLRTGRGGAKRETRTSPRGKRSRQLRDSLGGDGNNAGIVARSARSNRVASRESRDRAERNGRATTGLLSADYRYQCYNPVPSRTLDFFSIVHLDFLRYSVTPDNIVTIDDGTVRRVRARARLPISSRDVECLN